MMAFHAALALLAALFLVASCASFTPVQPAKTFRPATRLWAFEEELHSFGAWYGRGQSTAANDSDLLLKELKERKDELRRGIGKRFVVTTERGFLSVHRFPGDQVVNQLRNGEIVTSVDRIGHWVKHSSGGWSLAKYGAFVFLEPIVE